MKKLFFCFLAITGFAVLTSCDNSVLTASLAVDAIEKDVFWDDTRQTSDFVVGYYEIDKENIESFQQLQAAGVITLKVEKAVEKKVYNGWYSTKTEFIDHYFAEVALTEQGKKYVYEGKKLTGRIDQIEDMKLDEDEDAEEEKPDYMTNLPKLEIATLQPVPERPADDNSASANNSSSDTDSDAADADVQTPDAPKAEPTAYMKALDKVTKEEIKVVIGKFEIVKAKEVYCPQQYVEVGKGECIAIIEFTDKTPFGFVLGAPKNGERFSQAYELKRYEDLGWIVTEVKKQQ